MTKQRFWTYELAMAASRDAGNARMRKAGRKAWDRADYNHAVDECERLFPLARECREAVSA